MKKMKIKRLAVTAVLVLVCYLLQCTVFSSLELAGIKPNLMIIATSSIGFMRGSKEGMLVGFFSGLFIDIQFGTVIGMYALIYMLTGYVNGRFMQMYYDEDIKLPICLIAASEFIYGLIVYFLMFMLRSECQFWFYLNHIIIPELIYTIGTTIALYPLILYINRRLEAEEKRSASKFV